MPDLMTYMTQTGLLDEAELQDPEYDEYCKRIAKSDTYKPTTYKHWESLVIEWEEANQNYKRECEPFFLQSADDPPPEVQRRAKSLLRVMNYLETLLGY